MPAPALLHRFPRLRARPAASPILPPAERAAFPALEQDFAVLDLELVPRFEALDREAGRAQNGFRLAQVLLILGGLAATVLGAVQAVQASQGGAQWAGFAEAGVVAVLGAVLAISGDLRFKHDYLDARLQAERLRAEYFLYLARAAEYSGRSDEEAPRLLRRRVRNITTGPHG